MTRLTPRDRRVLLLGAIALAGGLLLGRGLPLWRRTFEQELGRAKAERRALVDARALIRAAPALRDSVEERRARYLSFAPALIPERNSNIAVARLEAAVSGAASSAGIAVSSLSLVADSTTLRILGRPRVRGEARGDVSGLLQFLLLLELGPPLLNVSALTVAQPDPAGHSGRAEELRISFLIEGASLAPVSTAPASMRP